MAKRQSNNPKRRIAPAGALDQGKKQELLETLQYVGSAIHKRIPANYGFHPPCNPRATKALCDDRRVIPRQEACALFEAGLAKGMISSAWEGDLPKYVWAVDASGEIYEAKIGNGGYHGCRLHEEHERAMREEVLGQWNAR